MASNSFKNIEFFPETANVSTKTEIAKLQLHIQFLKILKEKRR